jgi:hypothetical protein
MGWFTVLDGVRGFLKGRASRGQFEFPSRTSRSSETVISPMNVKPKKLELEMEAPLMFRPFRGKALEIIEREARVWLEKAKNGELK